jgi:hypothetical protein
MRRWHVSGLRSFGTVRYSALSAEQSALEECDSVSGSCGVCSLEGHQRRAQQQMKKRTAYLKHKQAQETID